MMLSFFFFFFFSSRRRHTRSLRDWSSDVCSSDLAEDDLQEGRAGDQGAEAVGEVRRHRDQRDPHSVADHRGTARRSEERRVGKSVDLGGRRSIKKKKKRQQEKQCAE